MRGLLRGLPIVGVGALGMGFLALPGAEERAAMMLRDGKASKGEQALTVLHQAGDRRPEIVLQLATLSDEAGRLAQSIAYYTSYVSIRPEDVAALQRLADLHLQNGDTRASLSLRERALKLAPTAEAAEALASDYQLHSRSRDEERLLRDLLHTDHITTAGLQRLGTLAANRGDLDTARAALEMFDQRGDPTDRAPRMLLFQILVDRAHYGEALNNAVRWSSAWKSEPSAMAFAAGFARAGQPNLVRDFAMEAARDIRGFELATANTLLRSGHTAIAQQLLASWINQPVVRTPRQIMHYIGLTEEAGGATRPFIALRTLARTAGREMQAARLAEGLADRYGKRSLAPFRSLLSPQILSQRPVFAAQLTFAEGNATLARRYLVLAKARRPSAEERRRWIEVAPRIDADGTYYALVQAWARTDLQADFRQTLIRMAHDRGDWHVHNAVVAQAAGPAAASRSPSANR